MKKFILSVAAVACSILLFAQGPLKGPLDKNIYLAEVFKEGKKKPLDPDELKFLTGKFKSKIFAQWGFTKAMPYKIVSSDSTNAEAIVYVWIAETVNDIKEVMKWSGTITGDDIEGTADLFNKEEELKWSYTFSGKLKGKPGKK